MTAGAGSFCRLKCYTVSVFCVILFKLNNIYIIIILIFDQVRFRRFDQIDEYVKIHDIRWSAFSCGQLLNWLGFLRDQVVHNSQIIPTVRIEGATSNNPDRIQTILYCVCTSFMLSTCYHAPFVILNKPAVFNGRSNCEPPISEKTTHLWTWIDRRYQGGRCPKRWYWGGTTYWQAPCVKDGLILAHNNNLNCLIYRYKEAFVTQCIL